MELHDLVAPPAAPGFRERLWEQAEEWQRRRARMWRVAALAATAVAITSISAAGVMAVGKAVTASSPPTFDQSMSCQVPVRGGVPVIDLNAEPTGWYFVNGVRKPRVAQVMLGTTSFGANQSVSYLELSSGPRGYGALKGAPCSKAPAVPLASAGLPVYDTVHAPSDGMVNAVNVSCFTGTTIAVRQHVQVVKGSPVAAQIAVRTGKNLRPLIYIDWTPKKITVYATADCHD